MADKTILGKLPAPITNPENWPARYADGWNDCSRTAYEEMTAALAEAEDDTKRLTWLMVSAAVVTTDGNGRWHVFFDWMPAGSQCGPWADGRRAAIDAAMAEPPPK